MCHLALSRPREEAHIWVTLCSPPPPRPRARRGAHCTLGTGPHRSPRPRPNPGPRWIFSVRRSRRQPSRCVLGGRQRVLCQAEECFLSAPLSGPCPSAGAPGRGSAAVSAGALRAGRPQAALRGTPRVRPGGCGWGTAGRAGYSQLGRVPGNALGEGAEPLVAASHHRLHAGALLRAARAQVTAALVVACGAPRASVAGDRRPQWGRASEAGCGDQGCAGRGPSALSRTGTTSLLASCVRGSGVPS